MRYRLNSSGVRKRRGRSAADNCRGLVEIFWPKGFETSEKKPCCDSYPFLLTSREGFTCPSPLQRRRQDQTYERSAIRSELSS